MAAMVQLPIIGGPLAGEVIGVALGMGAVKIVQPNSDAIRAIYMESLDDEALYTEVLYTVEKLRCILPGRTDFQTFRVLAHPGLRYSPLNRWGLEAALSDVTQAWSTGWAPPPESSEVWQLVDELAIWLARCEDEMTALWFDGAGISERLQVLAESIEPSDWER